MSSAPDNIECKHVLDLLDDYRRNSLSPAIHNQVERHLQQCESCATELAARELLAQHLRTSLPAAAPVAARLTPAVQTTINQATQSGNTRSRRGSSMLPWMLAAAVLIISAVALVQIRPPSDLKDIQVATRTTPRPDNRYEPAQPAPAPAQSVADFSDLERIPSKRDALSKKEISDAAFDSKASDIAPPTMMQSPHQQPLELAMELRSEADKAQQYSHTDELQLAPQLYGAPAAAQAATAPVSSSGAPSRQLRSASRSGSPSHSDYANAMKSESKPNGFYRVDEPESTDPVTDGESPAIVPAAASTITTATITTSTLTTGTLQQTTSTAIFTPL